MTTGRPSWNPVVSMVKGTAIILMVAGHSLPVGNWFRDYIYMFHMPLFFFVSGYCFKSKHLSDWRGFAYRRLRGLWWPFVKYGVPAVLLHNVFCWVNLYGAACSVEPYSASQILKAVAMQFAMSGAEPLLGAYWFLNTLLGASVLFYFSLRWLGCRWGFVALMAGSAGCLLLMPYVGMLRIVFRMFFAASYMMVGHCASVHLLGKPLGHTLWLAAVLALVVGVATLFLPHEMTDATLPTLLPCMVVAVAGVSALWLLCERLHGRWPQSRLIMWLAYAGDNTLVILTWHFLCFKLVTLLIVMMNHLPMSQLAHIPIIEEFASQGWWLAYLAAGVLLPLTFNDFRFLIRMKSILSILVALLLLLNLCSCTGNVFTVIPEARPELLAQDGACHHHQPFLGMEILV